MFNDRTGPEKAWKSDTGPDVSDPDQILGSERTRFKKATKNDKNALKMEPKSKTKNNVHDMGSKTNPDTPLQT